MSWDAIRGINIYLGESSMFLLVLISILYLIIKIEPCKERKKLAFYSLGVLSILIAPVLGNLLGRMVGRDVLWRMGWLFVIPMVLAYVFTHWYYAKENLKSAVPSNLIKGICGILVCMSLWMGKEFVLTSKNFTFEQNIYKISDESIEIADYLRKEETYYVLANPELASQIRQYEPNIQLFSGRWPNYEDQDSTVVFSILTEEVVDTKEMIRLCKKKNCETVILKDEILTDSMESLGASLIKEIGGYKIYRIVI